MLAFRKNLFQSRFLNAKVYSLYNDNVTWQSLKALVTISRLTLREKYPYSVCSGTYFPAFGLNTERYRVSLRIQSECRKNTDQKNSKHGHFSRSVIDKVRLFFICKGTLRSRKFIAAFDHSSLNFVAECILLFFSKSSFSFFFHVSRYPHRHRM